MLTLDSIQSVETRPSGLISVGDSEPRHLTEVLLERLLRPTERCGENVFLLCVFLLGPSCHYCHTSTYRVEVPNIKLLT